MPKFIEADMRHVIIQLIQNALSKETLFASSIDDDIRITREACWNVISMVSGTI